MLPEPEQKVLRLCVFGTPPPPRQGLRLRIFSETFAQNGLIFSGRNYSGHLTIS